MSHNEDSRAFCRLGTAALTVWVGLGVYQYTKRGYFGEDFWQEAFTLALFVIAWIYFEVRVGFDNGVEAQKKKAAEEQHLKERPQRLECGAKLGMTPWEADAIDLRVLQQRLKEAQENQP